jgi:metal-responsive CopG/Arc/MetJ family transcriptional regulator
MKTAISIPDEIFEEIDRYAKERHYSRSEIIVIAIRELLKKRESEKLLDALNKAYATAESGEEKTTRTKGKRHYAREVLKEKY